MARRIYLDTGDLAQIERLVRDRPQAAAEFFAAWAQLDCHLVLTMHHALEIAQLADDASRSRRISIIERMGELRLETGGSEKVLRLEITIALLAALDGISPDYSTEIADRLFPIVTIDELEAYLLHSVPMLALFRSPMTLAAEARNSSRSAKRSPAFRRIEAGSIDQRAAIREMENVFATQGTPADVQNMMRRMVDMLYGHLSTTGNMRSAMELALGLSEYCSASEHFDLLSVLG
jgi:hypothetical protein